MKLSFNTMLQCLIQPDIIEILGHKGDKRCDICMTDMHHKIF